MPFVASTLASSNTYTGYKTGNNDLPAVTHAVTIAGGAGVANRNIITPHGVVTEVSAEDAKFLKDHYLFKLHEENGHVQILDKRPEDADAVAADMNGADPGAPTTPQHYDKAPRTGGKR